MKRVLVIGEAMVELRPAASGPTDTTLFESSIAGDVYNTAVYLRRLMGERAQVSFLTGLGDDAVSQTMRARFEEESIDTSQVVTIAGGTPGLYMIHIDDEGERSFSYWRSASAARQMLDEETVESLAARLGGYDLVYFSGITLAILPPDRSALLIAAAEQARTAGTEIAFDPNYRARLWPSPEVAIAAYANAFAVSDIVLPGMDDERDLYGSASPQDTLVRLEQAGVREIILKAGSSVHLRSKGKPTKEVPVTPVAKPVDTTAAGDSFAAGWLAGWLDGNSPEEALELAKSLAAFVVTQPGAICPVPVFNAYLNERT